MFLPTACSVAPERLPCRLPVTCPQRRTKRYGCYVRVTLRVTSRASALRSGSGTLNTRTERNARHGSLRAGFEFCHDVPSAVVYEDQAALPQAVAQVDQIGAAFDPDPAARACSLHSSAARPSGAQSRSENIVRWLRVRCGSLCPSPLRVAASTGSMAADVTGRPAQSSPTVTTASRLNICAPSGPSRMSSISATMTFCSSRTILICVSTAPRSEVWPRGRLSSIP